MLARTTVVELHSIRHNRSLHMAQTLYVALPLCNYMPVVSDNSPSVDVTVVVEPCRAHRATQSMRQTITSSTRHSPPYSRSPKI